MRGLTILKLMTVTAVVAVDAWLIRAFLVDGMFAGLVGIVPTLQVGFWRARRTVGRRRRFWLGFVGGGLLGILGMIGAEVFPSLPLLRWFIDVAFRVRSNHFPVSVQDYFDDHEEVFFAVVYFVPVLASALVGGLLGAASGRRPASAEKIPAIPQPPES